ncbi:hypothetical protein CULCOIPH002_02720 [Corynebacterium ulcerans]|uniref:Uncharacterized protein n=1 Tax=Corynebacterium ulcerans TaxID=65058 RepID=A0ABD0BJJ0_CORUL|nr:hypothetical protein CULCOIPH001_16150 [Corynebacterium ulcerans]GJJ35360.1 hypothetical protein CULCOIPH002_02720 [Corynebacterium ulcerans]GJJ38205.1 hypothetical protein CULCOIPH003_08360 [Corynebacterium ulcerans]GJJ41209.1 hypothetical protein CULCOIPH004_16200 [Corynebacterium ulcerans]GJJ42871.1 hypothetical protein CULCOIPH005_10600 [Corynebacterium ulcerans]
MRGLRILDAGPMIVDIGIGRAGNVDKQKELGVNLALKPYGSGCLLLRLCQLEEDSAGILGMNKVDASAGRAGLWLRVE